MVHGRCCYQHDERPLVAYCDQCTRPCCRDCCVELFERYFCERCKSMVAQELQRDMVQPDAARCPIIAAIGIFLMGFVVGPYAIWRARMARRLLDRSPWLRGRWHLWATYVLAGFAIVQGVVSVIGRFMVES